jgi:hypothetical protein
VSIALLRVAAGHDFAKARVTKLSVLLVGDFVPLRETLARWLAAMPNIVARQASGNPLPFYKQYLEGVVLPHATLFAHLTAWGEAAFGVGLTLRLLPPIAAPVGLLVVGNTWWWVWRCSRPSWRGRVRLGGSTVGSASGAPWHPRRARVLTRPAAPESS